MGVFNTLHTVSTCPVCGAEGPFGVQFEYGDVWQHDYAPGDTLGWGGNDVGDPDAAAVVVEGMAGPCPACGAEFLDFEVLIEKNRLLGARPSRDVAVE